MGDANASIPTPQPVINRPMFGAQSRAASSTSLAFVSQMCIDAGSTKALGLRKPVEAIRGCRTIGKRDMVRNSATPVIEVDPETYAVTADGVLLLSEPATTLPLTTKYFLF